MALLCDPCDVFGASSNDDLLFGGMSLDLDDLFSDDLMGALLGASGPSTDLLATGLLPDMAPAPAAPCSSGDSHQHVDARTTSSSRSTSSGSSGDQVFQAPSHGSSGVTRLQKQRSAGPPTRKSAKQEAVRQVTTLPAAADEQVARSTAPSPPCVSAGSPAPAFFQQDELLAALLHSGEDTSNDESDSDMDDAALGQDGAAKKGSNKRKAPEIDWRSITDPSERRRQRRLAKNRMTAARSRERKKVQWADMEAKLARMDNDNKRLKAMLQQLAQENTALRGQLGGVVQGKQAPGSQGGHSHSIEPAALVLISIMLLLCCALPGDQAMLLGSAAPMLLLAQLLSQTHSSSSTHAPSQQPLATALLRFLLHVKLLLSRASSRLRTSVHRMLYRRHYHVGRAVLSKTAAWASTTTNSLLRTELLTSSSWRGGGPVMIPVKQEPLMIPVKQEPDDGLLSFSKQEPLDFPQFDFGTGLIACLG